jgi:predicted MFS family arabinose efflux permease
MPEPAVRPVLTRGLTILFAVACGASVANLYYAQPLLDEIADAFGVSSGTAGLLVTASQLGYATGLVLIVPLADLVHRRRLVTGLLLVAAAGLAVSAAAPGIAILAAATAVVGTTSVVAQTLVPFASSLADEEDRGAAVGTVMSGLLIGILVARTFSGVIAQLAGWRTVYVVAAVGMLALATVLWRRLPDVAPTADLPYGRLLASILTLVREEPVLRVRMVYGVCGMVAFSALWTSLTFLLSRQPYGYSEAAIGLFGLAGLVGAGSAQAAGRLADRGHTRAATGSFLLVIALSWGLLALGTTSIVALIAGIVLIDLGVQGQHILNQSTIYELRPDARARLTTAYMTTNFLFGAAGSALSAAAWSAGGWHAVSAMGAGVAVVALGVWLWDGRRGQ